MLINNYLQLPRPLFFIVLATYWTGMVGCAPTNDTTTVTSATEASSKQAPVDGSPIPVTVFKVSKQQIGDVLFATGQVQANKKAYLTFSEAGIVKALSSKNGAPLSSGDYVRKGAVIATIDNTSNALTINDANYAITDAEISLNTAQDQLERFEKLASIHAISQQKLHQADSQHQQATLKVAQAKNALKKLQSQTTNYQLTAPFSGIITNINLSQGEFVSPLPARQAEQNPRASHVTLIDPESLVIQVEVPVDISKQLHIGAQVAVLADSQQDTQTIQLRQSLPLTQLASAPYHSSPADINGQIKAIYEQLATNENTVRIEVALSASDLTQLSLGEARTVRFTYNTSEPTIFIPINTLVREDGKDYVFTTTSEGHATKRQVVLEDITVNGAKITQGLNVGDSVIIKGKNRIKEGTLITVMNRI